MNKLYAITAVALLLPCINSCDHHVIRVERQVEPVTVKVLSVKRGADARSTGFVGTVDASRTNIVNAPASGTLVSLPVRKGESVRKGQILADVRSETLESAHSMASASLEQAEDGWKRVQMLHESGTVSEAEYIKVQMQVQQARASESAARAALERCKPKAAFDGVVDEIWPSQNVELTIGQPILRLVDIKSLEIHFSLPEGDFGKYQAGQAASVEIPSLGKTLPGRLAVKGTQAAVLSRSYDCTVTLGSKAEGLMPGMVCKVYLRSTSNEDRIEVPSSSVLTDMDGRYVWAVQDSVVCKKRITVAGYSKDGILVSEGLEEGDRVIIEGRRKVSSGVKVKTVE